jgi:RNA polymerase-binding transcription factor DksA
MKDMDEADLAEERANVFLEAAKSARLNAAVARADVPVATHCIECGDEIDTTLRRATRCVDCQEEADAKQRRGY